MEALLDRDSFGTDGFLKIDIELSGEFIVILKVGIHLMKPQRDIIICPTEEGHELIHGNVDASWNESFVKFPVEDFFRIENKSVHIEENCLKCHEKPQRLEYLLIAIATGIETTVQTMASTSPWIPTKAITKASGLVVPSCEAKL